MNHAKLAPAAIFAGLVLSLGACASDPVRARISPTRTS